MKAHDKLYIGLEDVGSGYVFNTSVLPNGYDEYIRKDALLEWAKETYLTENASAIRKVCFKQLVEKLMSM